MAENNKKILCQNLWKIFGSDPESAFQLIKNGESKQEFMEETGNVIAIRDASFDVKENEVFVIMGLSGSGKSTLVRCINRLIEPTKGTIFIEDTDIAQMDNHSLKELRRHKLSMVFQSFGLLPHRSVLENVAFGLEVRGEGREDRHKKAFEALEMVGLKGWERSQIFELSGGMQQRVGLARALAVGSEILLMDEPFSALDPLIRRQMQEEFVNLHSKLKRTVVFITHDLIEALRLGDRIAIMRDGKIVQLGTPQEIVSSPADDYVREFVKDVPRGKVIECQSIMEKPSAVVPSDQPVTNAIEEMKKKDTEMSFVVDTSGVLKGTLTMDQALATARKGSTKVGDIASREFPATPPNTQLDQCLQLVAEGDTPVAVTDDKQRLLGVITRPLVLKAVQSDVSVSAEA